MGDDGRAAFARMAPKGYRVRMMEPGEVPALRRIASARLGPGMPDGSGPPGLAEASLDDFVRWLLGHEVFVAETKAGVLAGFAAARDVVDLYWLAALAVSEGHEQDGVDKALLKAVLARAGWFFHRAVAMANAPDAAREDFYRTRGFMTVPRKDVPSTLIDALATEPRLEGAPDTRDVMIKWL